MKWLLIAFTTAAAIIRLWPGFPAHGVSLEGSYEAIVHVATGSMFCGPVVFWIVRRIVQSVLVNPNTIKVDSDSYRNGLIDASRSIRDVLNACESPAYLSLFLALFLTFVVEAGAFLFQVLLP